MVGQEESVSTPSSNWHEPHRVRTRSEKSKGGAGVAEPRSKRSRRRGETDSRLIPVPLRVRARQDPKYPRRVGWIFFESGALLNKRGVCRGHPTSEIRVAS